MPEEKELTTSITISLKDDNQRSIALTYNSVFHARSKHINIQHHYICDKVVAKKIELLYMPTEDIITDGLTKALTYVKFHGFIAEMKMIWERINIASKLRVPHPGKIKQATYSIIKKSVNVFKNAIKSTSLARSYFG